MPNIDETSPWPALPLSRLLRPCTNVVPLLGAGISQDAGLPGGKELADWIRAHELASGVDFSSLPEAGARASPLDVSQWLVDRRPHIAEALRAAVRHHLVALCARARIVPHLEDLARTPGRLIVTLNYDDLIERAAEQQGLVLSGR